MKTHYPLHMLIRILTIQPSFLLPIPISLEVNISRGIKFHIVGNVHSSIKENRQRIYTTLKNCGWHWPGQRITLNFRPLEIHKSGSHYDLPIAIGILAASGQIKSTYLENHLFCGALQLDGQIEETKNVFNVLECAFQNGIDKVVLNTKSADTQRFRNFFKSIEVINVSQLSEVVHYLQYRKMPVVDCDAKHNDLEQFYGCFSEVNGLVAYKRALEIAAAGNHSVLLIGAPGIGKTMLLSRIDSIMPPINPDDIRVTEMITSKLERNYSQLRPFIKIAPVESIKSLFGSIRIQNQRSLFMEKEVAGKLQQITDQISNQDELGKYHYAIGGAMFMDEISSYPKAILDTLQIHMDDSNVQFLMAMNPCHCGYFNHPVMHCDCTASNLNRYQGILSGALKDRIDLMPPNTLMEENVVNEKSSVIKTRVHKAWERQIQRQGKQNGKRTLKELMNWVLKDGYLKQVFLKQLKTHKWSLRKQRSILSVAATIADLNQAIPSIDHLKESMVLSNSEGNPESSAGKIARGKSPTVILAPDIKIKGS